ncbi:hypothetical protein JOD07_002019 [Defluviitalea raffinosedens]|nr:hypothetical protein [Defluviitalea raffinosedens]
MDISNAAYVLSKILDYFEKVREAAKEVMSNNRRKNGII